MADLVVLLGLVVLDIDLVAYGGEIHKGETSPVDPRKACRESHVQGDVDRKDIHQGQIVDLAVAFHTGNVDGGTEEAAVDEIVHCGSANSVD